LVQNSVTYFMDGPAPSESYATVGCITVGDQNNSEASLNWRSIIQAMVHLM